ncbi:MAG: ATP-binding protein [Thermoproteus sp.]
MRRIRLRLAGFAVDFADREAALKRVEEWADRGTALPHVVYGPEGCGKTAWLKQSAELLRELGFEVVYVDPLHLQFAAYTDMRDFVERLAEAAAEAFGIAQLKLATLAVEFAKEAVKRRKRKVAVLVDDVFSAIGLDKAAIYVKSMLGLIEHPPGEYEKVVAVAAASEGTSLREIGRHSWAATDLMWNMSMDGFRQLYDQLPGGKPPLEEAFKLTGGNPRILERLYEAGWDVDKVAADMAREKGLSRGFVERWRDRLEEAVDDPDSLWHDAPEELVDELVERNLIVYFLPDRDRDHWVDAPPPERDPELGIGRYVAWQTPLHREAVRRALGAG